MKETRLREQIASQLKNKDDTLAKERTQAMDIVARLDHSMVQHQLATDRAMVSEERARATEELAKAKSKQAKATKDQAKAAKARATRATEEYKDSDTFEADAAVLLSGPTTSSSATTRRRLLVHSRISTFTKLPQQASTRRMSRRVETRMRVRGKSPCKSPVRMILVRRLWRSLHLISSRSSRLQPSFCRP